MAEKTNPYIAGAPVVEKSMFFGREGVFDWIENSLTGKYVDHILVLHGQRRVGKTSVLKHIPNRLPDKYIPIFIDLQGRVSTSLGRFLGWLAREISRTLQAEGIDIPRPDRKAFEEDPDYFEATFLPTVKKALGNRTLLLTFDEFDTFESTDAQESLAVPFMAILKRLMDHHYLSFVFSIGSSGRKLENMQAAYTSFFKQALYRKISFLETNDAHDLIVKPVAGVVDYTFDAIERIIEVTSAHPYFIQLVCHELFSECQKNDVWSVTKENVDDVLEPVVERGTVNLKFVWDEASDLEKWVLASLASTEQAISITEIEATLTREQVRFTRQQLERALLHLKEKDVIFEDNRFVIYLLKMWLERNRPMEQVREELEEVNPIVSRLLEIGQEYHNKGEFDRAIENFEEALANEKENHEAHLWLGKSQLARGDYGKAIAEFETVLEIKIDNVVAQKGFCDAYLAMGDESKAEGKLEEAEYAYQQVLGVNPQHIETLRRMAELHHRRAVNAITGSQETALEELKTALEYAEDETLKIAYQELKAFIAGECKLGDLLLIWGQKAQEMELWDEAQDLLNAYRRESGDEQTVQAAIEEIHSQITQQRQDALHQRANRLTRLNRYDEAIETWQRYLQVAPEQSEEVRAKITGLQAQAKAETEKAKGISPMARNLVIAVVVVLIAVIGFLLVQPTSPLMLALAGPTSTPETSLTPTSTSTLTPTTSPDPNLLLALEYIENEEPFYETEFSPSDFGLHHLVEDEKLALSSQNGDWNAYQIVNLVSNSYVIEVDLNILDGAQDQLYCGIYASNNEIDENSRGITLDIQKNGTVTLGHPVYPNHEIIKATTIDNDFSQPTTIREIVLGEQIFVYVNGQILYSAVNPDGSTLYNFHELVSQGNPITCVFDNYKLWDLSEINLTNDTAISTHQPTAIPLKWSRISSAAFIQRDSVTTIVFDPNDPDVIYAGTGYSGLYKTINGGITWEPIQVGIEGHRVNSLIIHPTDSNTLYTGILDDGAYKTTNGGETWEEMPIFMGDDGVWQFTSEVTLDPNNPDTVFYSNGTSIFFSSNAGEDWQKYININGEPVAELSVSPKGELYLSGPWRDPMVSRIPPERNQIEEFDFFACDQFSCGSTAGNHYNETVTFSPINGRIFASFKDYLYYSSDDGQSWQNTGMVCVRVEFDASGNGLCIEFNSFYTPDGGDSWRQINRPNNFHIMTGAISPHDPDTIIIGGEYGLYKSTDQGQTWEDISSGIGSGQTKLTLDFTNDQLYIQSNTNASDFGDTYVAPVDSRDFKLFKPGTRVNQSYSYLAVNGDWYYFYLNENSTILSLSVNNGPQQTLPFPIESTQMHPLGNLGGFVMDGKEYLYVQITGVGQYVSEDYGKTWDLIDYTIIGDSNGIGPIFPDPAKSGNFYSIGTELYYSQDEGQTWYQCGTSKRDFWFNFGMWPPDNSPIISPDPREPGHVFYPSTSEGLIVSTNDDCTTMDKIPQSSGLTNPFIQTVIRNPENPDIIYVGTANGFFISYNNGETWGAVNDGLLGALTIYSLTVDPNNPGVVYASTPYGIFKLEDN